MRQQRGVTEQEAAWCVRPHLAVWLDHDQARLIWLYRVSTLETIVHRHDPGATGNAHHHRGTAGNGHAGVDPAFLAKVSQAIGTAEEVLILGPVEARSALKAFLQHNNPRQAIHVLDDQAMENAGTAQIAAHARKFFRHADMMRQGRN